MESYPAWSAKEADVYSGTELKYERMLSVPPLQGWWGKRCFENRVFTGKVGSNGKEYFGDFEVGRVLEVKDMGDWIMTRVFAGANAGQCGERFSEDFSAIRQYFKSDKSSREIYRFTRSDDETSDEFFGSWLPYPDQDLLVKYQCEDYEKTVTPCDHNPAINCTFYEPREVDIPCKFEGYDVSRGSDVSSPKFSIDLVLDVTLGFAMGGEYYPGYARFVTVENEYKLFVSDRNQSAYFIDSEGKVESADPFLAQDCFEAPKTTSSRVRSDGKYLVTKNGKVKVENNGPFSSFNCEYNPAEERDATLSEESAAPENTATEGGFSWGIPAASAGGLVAGIVGTVAVYHFRSNKRNSNNAAVEDLENRL